MRGETVQVLIKAVGHPIYSTPSGFRNFSAIDTVPSIFEKSNQGDSSRAHADVYNHEGSKTHGLIIECY
jgi:hypothetical protein